ncbi:MAG: SDR family oxidoreductase [Acidobacteria bacterium]|nr:SDR family oxidoreductase [Acidobacteriota bacterium]
MTRFEEKVAVIAGGSGGIGIEVARGIVREGGSVLLFARNADRLASAEADLLTASPPSRVATLAGDATNAADLDRAVAVAKERFGRLDVWVHAVGSILLKSVFLTSEAEFALEISRNLTSAFLGTRVALGPMRSARSGSIVLFGSAAGQTGLPNHAAIAAAKAGIVGLARAAAMDAARYGIRINVVAPGLVRTPMAAFLTDNEASLKASAAMHATGRISEARDVAAAVLYLASDDAANVTGAVLPVDGGLSAGRPPVLAR